MQRRADLSGRSSTSSLPWRTYEIGWFTSPFDCFFIRREDAPLLSVKERNGGSERYLLRATYVSAVGSPFAICFTYYFCRSRAHQENTHVFPGCGTFENLRFGLRIYFCYGLTCRFGRCFLKKFHGYLWFTHLLSVPSSYSQLCGCKIARRTFIEVD